MADQLSSGSDSVDLDGLRGQPTFIQIHPPLAHRASGKWIGAGFVGLALAAALGWASYRLTIELRAPIVAEVATTPAVALAPPPASVDLSPELAIVAIDAAVASPVWSRASLMEWVEPFESSAGGRAVQALASQAAPSAPDTPPTGPYEVSVRLGKGETIGSALQKRGFAADAVVEAVAALALHVSLKRLPVGSLMILQVRPAPEDSARPILQALTLQLEARRNITVARDGQGNYAVERR